MRNVLLTMREDMEQKSNDHHPVRWHWRVVHWGGLWTRTRLAAAQWPVWCHIQPAPPPAAAAAAPAPDWGRSDGLVGAQSWLNWTTAVRATGAIQLLAIFLFSHWLCSCIDLWSVYPKGEKKKFVVTAVSSSQTASELCRIRTRRSSSTVVQPELRSVRSDCMAHLCERRNVIGPWKDWICPWGVKMFPMGEQLGLLQPLVRPSAWWTTQGGYFRLHLKVNYVWEVTATELSLTNPLN